jgi:hypothetical protein
MVILLISVSWTMSWLFFLAMLRLELRALDTGQVFYHYH